MLRDERGATYGLAATIFLAWAALTPAPVLLTALWLGPSELEGAEQSASPKSRLGLDGWKPSAPREEIKPEFAIDKSGGRDGRGALVIRTDGRPGLFGYWEKTVPIEGGRHYRFEAFRKASHVEFPRRSVNARIIWLDEQGKVAMRDLPVVGPYHPKGAPDQSTAEFPPDRGADGDGWTALSAVYRAPAAARKATIELHLEWAESAQVEWSDVSLTRTDAPAGRVVRLATIHYIPSGKVSPADNCRQFEPLIAEAARQKADLVVLPETLTHTNTGLDYAAASEPIPGPSTDFFGTLARAHKLHVVVGLLERVEHVVYNVAVLIGPDGAIIGKYRKVCLPRTEVEMGITPGDEYPVFDTLFGKVGMMICYDGFFPEVARELANNGAEVIAFPVAGCNPMLAAARACENHAYVVSSTYCDVSLNWMISGIYGHQGEILAQATRWGTVAVAEVDLDRPTIWGNIGDYKAQLLRHRPATAGEQVAAALARSEETSPENSGHAPDAHRATKTASPSPNDPRSSLPLPPSRGEGRGGGGKRLDASPNTLTPAPVQSEGRKNLRIPPKEPAEALKTFQTQDGFRLDLLAAEPLTTDPVAIEYGEDGLAYVVEMSDYPYTDKTKDKPFTEKTADLPIGRVRILEDVDGDGTFDRSTIFAEELSWPTGLALWQGGVYVAATPDLWYLKDTDGDRKADVRRKVFTGFHKFNVQAVMNNLRWGLDHRLYGAGGTNGGAIVRIADGQAKPQKMAANDFRFDPHTEAFELISGGARFGHAFDDWGNRFICNIRNPVRHAVIEDKYLSRNPLLPVASPLHDAAEAGDALAVFRTSPPEPWRVINARRLSGDPTAVSPRSEMVAAGYVTSTCGVTIYRGAAYPPEYYGQAFLGEVAANLIHRQRLVPDGMTFKAERIDERVEFVTSTDNWFRPVNFANAPDGTLHVLDMYRETIEHPWSIPDDIKEQLDLESGRDRGRIYRLTPPDFRAGPRPHLGKATTAELVATLANPNSWWRETAHRLLYERQDQSAVPLLRELLRRRSRDQSVGQPPPLALGRLHALWTLDGLDALEDGDLQVALGDPKPEVIEHAIRLAEPRLARSAKLRGMVLALAHNQNERVRCQVALSAGALTGDEAVEARAEVARRAPADPWTRVAVLSGVPETAAALLVTLCGGDAPPLGTIRTLAMVVGARNSEVEIAQVLRSLGQDAGSSESGSSALVGREVVLGLSEGLDRHNLTLTTVTDRVEPGASSWLAGLARDAATLAADGGASPTERVQAITLLGQGAFDRIERLLNELLGSQQPQEVQLAAVQAMARHAQPEVPARLIAAYRGLTPGVRAEVIHHLLSRPEWIVALLDAVDAGALTASDIPQGRRAILLRSGDAQIKSRAADLFTRESLGSRKEIVEEYRPALELAADASRGRAVSKKICQTCHRLRGEGQDVGPPLETIRHRSPDEVLLHTLDPNREVSPNFLEYVVLLKSGKTTTGVIAAETPTSVTLRRAEGAQETILRSDIEDLSSTGKSIMPEGLEKQITPQEMADLLAFLLAKN